jgi:hypothetical protein
MASTNGTAGIILTKEELAFLSKEERSVLREELLESHALMSDRYFDLIREEMEKKRDLSEAMRAQRDAYEQVDILAARLNASRRKLTDAIKKANTELKLKDEFHDSMDYALGLAGLIAAGVLSGGWALVVGGVLLGAGELNKGSRQTPRKDAPNGLRDFAGNVNNAVGTIDDIADVAGVGARPVFGIAGAGAGLALSVVEAQTNTSIPLQARVGSARELRALPRTIDLFSEEYENLGSFPGEKLKELSRDTLELQEKYDAAVAAAVAADRVAAAAEITWIETYNEASRVDARMQEVRFELGQFPTSE